jgi:hypothetical protein
MTNTNCAASIAFFAVFCGSAAGTTAQTEIRVGIIGTDTSHVTAFTRLLNDMNDPNHVPGARVVAAFKGGSPDVEASSYADAREIVRLSRESGVPFFSSSSLRFVADVQAMKNSSKHGGISGAFTFGPENLEPHHPDLFWYASTPLKCCIRCSDRAAKRCERPFRLSRDLPHRGNESDGDVSRRALTGDG